MRIIQQPVGRVDGISLAHYRLGQIYELPPSIAEYLVMRGYGQIEMRREQRSKRNRPVDRRHQR